VNPGVALLWDMTHSVHEGVPFPPPSLPLPGDNWIPYSHPSYPALAFLHPPDWTPYTITDIYTIGVDLIRSDSAAAAQYLATWDYQGATARQWVEFGLRTILDLAPQEPLDVLCESELLTNLAPGIDQYTSVLVVSVGPLLGIASASITTSEGLSGGSVFYGSAIGPAQEYTQLTDEVLLPILWQFLCGRDNG
jgi:hypothetical protein